MVMHSNCRQGDKNMIISASRRTDIPAFYSEWFYNRLKEGFVYVINPFNRKQVSKLELNNKTVDCFVFWTKDPEPMIDNLGILDKKGFNYYFQFTITAYQKDIEVGLRKKNDIVNTFRKLSQTIGKDKVIWRYDPILINDIYTKEYHYKWFEVFCKKLMGYTKKCVISFLDLYAKTKKNTKELGLQEIKKQDMYEIADMLSQIARKYDIKIETCSEGIDLTAFGVKKGKCIDDRLLSKILDVPLEIKKDDTQREVCGCVKSIDIGQYNTCQHHCVYCYANYNYAQVEANCKIYDSNSPILMGKLKGDEKITLRKMESIISKNDTVQLELRL